MNVYIVNAFTRDPFGGNPAAIMPLDNWLPDPLMQRIAAQHNLAETAFVVPEGDRFRIRWFTPAVEVDLCGHATLAAGHVFFHHLGYGKKEIIFDSKSGPLTVTRENNGQLVLNFPANPPYPDDIPEAIARGLFRKPVEVLKSTFDYLAVFESEEDIRGLRPDFRVLAEIPSRGLIVTAPGRTVDFVSRGFFPQSGIDEDPVTGSAHTVLAPYWSRRLGKKTLSARQLSARTGDLTCTVESDRVLIAGFARTYLQGTLAAGFDQ